MLNQLSRTAKILIGLVVVIAIGLAVSQLAWYKEGNGNLTSLLIISAITCITFGNYVLSIGLDKILPWKEKAITRFFVHLITGTAFSLLILNLVYYFFRTHYFESQADTSQIATLNVFGASIILPIFSLFFGYKFLKAWRKSELESERLQKENVRSQMMTLRNHLDPHFLFNNLNTVSSLIDHDAELSKDYLDKFAEVYRIILRTETSDLTTVEEELNLIDSYIYLLKIRFQDRVFFQIEINEADKKRAILPLSLQMLIENAIKHNRVSKQHPLTIKIKSTGQGHLSVENIKQVKKYSEEKRQGTGLKNISDRYQFFTEQAVEVKEDETVFKVLIPLIEIEYDD